MDGTLIDSSVLLANTINHVRQNLGLEALDNFIITTAINDTSINPAEFFYESDRFETIHEKLFQEYYLQNHHTQTKLYKGIGDLLKSLCKNHHLSIATNAYDVSTMPLLDALEINNYFDIVVCANQVSMPKPNPMMIDKIISHYKEDRNSFVMIGDATRDIEAAKNANIDAILVDWGFSDHKDAVCDVNQLANLLGVDICF